MFCVERSHMLGMAALFVTVAQMASACIAPEKPYLPARPEDVRAYADLLRADFEGYIADIQDPRCRAPARLPRGAGGQPGLWAIGRDP